MCLCQLAPHALIVSLGRLGDALPQGTSSSSSGNSIPDPIRSHTLGSFPDSQSRQPPPNLPTLDLVLSTHIPTLHHVPKGARDSWAASLSTSLSSTVANPTDSTLWLKLLMLAKCVLASPASGYHLRWRETLS